MNNNGIEWFSVDRPYGSNKPEWKDIPEWKRTAGRTKDGEVYLPAIILGNEIEALMRCGHDGEPIATCDKHLFVRSSFIKKERPNLKNKIEEIEMNVLSWKSTDYQEM